MSDSWVPEFDTTQLRLELVSSDGSTFSEEFPCGIEWSTSQSPSLGVVAIGYDALVEARSLANDMPDATMKELRQILSKRRDSSQSKTIDVLGLKIELLIPRVIGPLIILVLWILLSLHLRQARHDLQQGASASNIAWTARYVGPLAAGMTIASLAVVPIFAILWIIIGAEASTVLRNGALEEAIAPPPDAGLALVVFGLLAAIPASWATWNVFLLRRAILEADAAPSSAPATGE